jgi:hypothetical protein
MILNRIIIFAFTFGALARPTPQCNDAQSYTDEGSEYNNLYNAPIESEAYFAEKPSISLPPTMENAPYEQPRSGDNFQMAMIDMHNNARRRFGNPDLTYDPALENTASQAAQYQCGRLESGYEMQHKTFNEGENLYRTTGSFSDIELANLAFESWDGEERIYFAYGQNPESDSRFEEYGHWTQIQWKSTTSMGCSYMKCNDNSGNSVIVCRYSPAGNLMDQDQWISNLPNNR